MVGTLVIYSSVFQESWSLNPRTSTPNSSTSHDSVPPLVDEVSIFTGLHIICAKATLTILSLQISHKSDQLVVRCFSELKLVN